MQAFLSGVRPAIAEPYQLSSLAGHLAFAELRRLGRHAGAAAAYDAANALTANAAERDVQRRWRKLTAAGDASA